MRLSLVHGDITNKSIFAMLVGHCVNQILKGQACVKHSLSFEEKKTKHGTGDVAGFAALPTSVDLLNCVFCTGEGGDVKAGCEVVDHS